ncbi:MAG: hypothetical protein AAF845_00475 [Bacteroidota bacterium]
MIGLSVQSPFGTSPRSPEAVDVGDAIQRALDEAGTVSGAFASSPCRIAALPVAAGAQLRTFRPAGFASDTCVLVTVRGSTEADHRAHLHERCLTAAQRFMLALSCEGVRNAWTAEVPEAETLGRLGVDIDGQVPVGLIWCMAEE